MNLQISPSGITVAAEDSSTPATTTTTLNVLSTNILIDPFTLPTTYKLYQITGIEWKNGATVNGNISCGIYTVDANPPVSVMVVSMGFGRTIAQSGANSVQRNSDLFFPLIPGGTIIAPWVTCSSATATLAFDGAAASVNRTKAVAYTATPALIDNTAWSASVNRCYIKVYYKGYN